MTYQEKVEILRKYKDAMKMAKYYQSEIAQYRETYEQAKIQRLSGMPTSHGNNSDLSDYIVKLEEMNGKMYTKLLQAERIKSDIMVWVMKLDNVDERLIIQYHYLQDHKFGWIADEMHYGLRTIKRKHGKAITNLPEPEFAWM